MRRGTISQPKDLPGAVTGQWKGDEENGCGACRRLNTCSPDAEKTIMKRVAGGLKHKQIRRTNLGPRSSCGMDLSTSLPAPGSAARQGCRCSGMPMCGDKRGTCAIRPAYETAFTDGINPRILILPSSRAHIKSDSPN